MANEFDTLFAGVRDDLATLGGKAITLNQVTKGAYNPQTGTTSADVVTNLSVKGRIKQFDQRLIDGTDIKIGDFMVDIYTSTTIDLEDTITLDGSDYAVKQVLNKVYAVEDVIYQVLHVRAL